MNDWRDKVTKYMAWAVIALFVIVILLLLINEHSVWEFFNVDHVQGF